MRQQKQQIIFKKKYIALGKVGLTCETRDLHMRYV